MLVCERRVGGVVERCVKRWFRNWLFETEIGASIPVEDMLESFMQVDDSSFEILTAKFGVVALLMLVTPKKEALEFVLV